MNTPGQGSCALCGRTTSLRCSGCSGPFYCSKEHQKECWKSHRHQCQLYYKLEDQPFQRSKLLSSKEIPKGTVIMMSKAILTMPSGEMPVCLGCLRSLFYDVMSYQCEGCGWPMCNIECSTSDMHKMECEAMQKAGFSLKLEQLANDSWVYPFSDAHGPLMAIGVLRILLCDQKADL